MEHRIANIKQLEAAHNRLENTITNLEKLLHEWESLLPEYKKLIRYYESPQWQKDYEYSNSGDFPKDVACGILAEDTLYNLFGLQRGLALRMLKGAVQVLED